MKKQYYKPQVIVVTLPARDIVCSTSIDAGVRGTVTGDQVLAPGRDFEDYSDF